MRIVARQPVDTARPQQMKPRLAVFADVDVALLKTEHESAVVVDAKRRLIIAKITLAQPLWSVALWVLLLICLAPAPCAGTAVVIVRDDTRITVGTDSRVFTAHEGPVPGPPKETCKISSCGPNLIATLGLYDAPGFNVSRYLARFCDNSSPLRMAEKLAAAVAVEWQGDGLPVKRHWPAIREKVLNETPILTAIFFGLAEGVPAYAIRKVFVELESPGIRVTPIDCPPDCGPLNKVAIQGFGIDKRIQVRSAEYVKPGWTPEGLINRTIHEQANIEPRKVWPPIDIIRVGSPKGPWRGACWLQAKPECQKQSGIPLCAAP